MIKAAKTKDKKTFQKFLSGDATTIKDRMHEDDNNYKMANIKAKGMKNWI